MLKKIALAMIISFICSPSFAVIVNWAVGDVGGKIVTRREVQINYIIERILNPNKKLGSREKWILTEGSKFLEDQVTSFLLEKVVSEEAQNFAVGKVSDLELNEAVSQVKQSVSDWRYWSELEVESTELKAQIMQKLRAKKFIKFKADSTVVQITTTEAQAYYDRNRIKFGNLPFASFETNIKQFLSRKQMNERLRDWFEVLKRKYKVRNIESEGMRGV